jgi:hypothetical protein
MAITRLLAALVVTCSVAFLVAVVLGAPVPGVVAGGLVLVESIALLARNRIIVKRAGSLEADRVWTASRGWTATAFELDGLEADGEKLRELTDIAEAHGYRREPGRERYTWRFSRPAEMPPASEPTVT